MADKTPLWLEVRRLIGLIVIRWGWHIYPDCKDKRLLTIGLEAWSAGVAGLVSDEEGKRGGAA